MPDEQQNNFRCERNNLDEQLASIDCVCAAPIDSRCGLGRSEGMTRNSAPKSETETASWLDTFKGDIFPLEVIRRHQFRRYCALMSVGIGHSSDVSISYGDGISHPSCFDQQQQRDGMFAAWDMPTHTAEPARAGDNSTARPPPQPQRGDIFVAPHGANVG
ncbi:MAG: hypothetical protein AB7J13_03540 [Pyrinomonadaceae bacterium]